MDAGNGMFPQPGQWQMGQMPQAMPPAMQAPEAVQAPEPEETDTSHRPPNAFILYSQAMRSQVRQENPSLSNTEVSRLLGKMWKEVPSELKLQYKQKAAAMQEEFKREHPDYTYRKARRKRALNELLTKSSNAFAMGPSYQTGFPPMGVPLPQGAPYNQLQPSGFQGGAEQPYPMGIGMQGLPPMQVNSQMINPFMSSPYQQPPKQ